MNEAFYYTNEEATDSEKAVISNIIKDINKRSFVKLSAEEMSLSYVRYNYDSYIIKSDNGKEYNLKISFSQLNPLTLEYNFIRGVSSLEVAPSAMSIYPFEYLGEMGLALLKSYDKGVSIGEGGSNSIFSAQNNARRFFSILAKIASLKTKSILYGNTESNIIAHVGDFAYFFGEEFSNQISKMIGLDSEREQFKELRKSLMSFGKGFDLGRIVNSKLTPWNVLSVNGSPYIREWEKAFLGNPLYDFMNFILENELYEISEPLKNIYFEEIDKEDKSLCFEMKRMYSSYFNYFIGLQLWICTIEYIELYACAEMQVEAKIDFIVFAKKFNMLVSHFHKNIPFCSDIVDKISSLVNINNDKHL